MLFYLHLIQSWTPRKKPIPVTPVAAVEERTRAEHANDIKGGESPSHPTHPSRYTTLNELTSW